MVSSEREMVRRFENEGDREPGSTSLQPTYEDSVAPTPDDWEQEQE